MLRQIEQSSAMMQELGPKSTKKKLDKKSKVKGPQGALQQIDLQNFDRMDDMDEDSKLAAQLQAFEMMESMNNPQIMMGDDQQAEALRRYERRLEQEKRKKKNKSGVAGIERDRPCPDGAKSPSIAEKFLNFIGCGAKSKKDSSKNMRK
jgi:hypothetical protein